MEPLAYPLAFLAGLVSVFSPCVLPLLPLVFGTAASQHRLGPLALAAGLALSFLGVGLFVATVGFSLGIDGAGVRVVGAMMLSLAGVVLLIPPLQARMAVAAGPVANWAAEHTTDGAATGLRGQFCVGLLLGAVWSPCVGPTLGAASVLASQGKHLMQVSLTMLLFAVGVALPLIAVGLLSREAMMRWRGRLLATGRNGKIALGVVLLATGTLLLAGWDKALEASALNVMPGWLVDLTMRF